MPYEFRVSARSFERGSKRGGGYGGTPPGEKNPSF